MTSDRISRRRLVGMGLAAAALPIVAACGAAAPPTPAPAATSAPASSAPASGQAASPAATKPAAVPQSGSPAPAATAPAAASPAASTKPAQAAGAVGGSVVFAQFQSVPSLDPKSSGGALSAHEVLRHIYDGLVVFDDDLNPKPALAESWEVAPDQKAWTFKLRKNAKFHDGSPVTAAAVKDYFTYWFSFTSALGTVIASTEAVDPTTLKVTTREPFAAFLPNMAHAFGGVVSMEAIKKWGDDYSAHAVGTGPYKLKEFVPNERTVLVRNDDYYGGRPKLDQITFRAVPEDGARSNMLETGEADVIIPVPANSVERLRGSANLQILAKPVLTCQYIGMNLSRAPLDDLKVRQAFNHAVDKETIVKRLQGGLAHVADSPMAAQAKGYVSTRTYEYSPQKARALLAEAGFAPGADGILARGGKPLSLTMLTPVNLYPKDTQLAEAVQAQLKAVGVDVKLQQVESGNWFNTLRVPLAQATYDLFLWSLTPTTGDGNQALRELFRSDPDPAKPPSSWNLTRYKSARMDELIATSDSTIDEAKRQAAMKEGQQIAMDGAMYIYLYSHDHVAGARKQIRGVRIIPNRLVDLREASRES
jgi:ABC-type transport system substrate-binding protein